MIESQVVRSRPECPGFFTSRSFAHLFRWLNKEYIIAGRLCSALRLSGLQYMESHFVDLLNRARPVQSGDEQATLYQLAGLTFVRSDVHVRQYQTLCPDIVFEHRMTARNRPRLSRVDLVALLEKMEGKPYSHPCKK
jgi:hypothetical protein